MAEPVIRMQTLEERIDAMELFNAEQERRRAAAVDDLAAFDPLDRNPGGRRRKEVPADIAPMLWADVQRVLNGEDGWGWRTVWRKYQQFQFSIRWLKRVAADGSLERMASVNNS